jgi:hypothetical protein
MLLICWLRNRSKWHADCLPNINVATWSNTLLPRSQVSSLTEQCADAKRELDRHILASDATIKFAMRDAQLNERAHYACVIDAHKSKTTTLSSIVDELKSRTVSAELDAKRALAQANRSARR